MSFIEKSAKANKSLRRIIGLLYGNKSETGGRRFLSELAPHSKVHYPRAVPTDLSIPMHARYGYKSNDELRNAYMAYRQSGIRPDEDATLLEWLNKSRSNPVSPNKALDSLTLDYMAKTMAHTRPEVQRFITLSNRFKKLPTHTTPISPFDAIPRSGSTWRKEMKDRGFSNELHAIDSLVGFGSLNEGKVTVPLLHRFKYTAPYVSSPHLADAGVSTDLNNFAKKQFSAKKPVNIERIRDVVRDTNKRFYKGNSILDLPAQHHTGSAISQDMFKSLVEDTYLDRTPWYESVARVGDDLPEYIDSYAPDTSYIRSLFNQLGIDLSGRKSVPRRALQEATDDIAYKGSPIILPSDAVQHVSIGKNNPIYRALGSAARAKYPEEFAKERSPIVNFFANLFSTPTSRKVRNLVNELKNETASSFELATPAYSTAHVRKPHILDNILGGSDRSKKLAYKQDTPIWFTPGSGVASRHAGGTGVGGGLEVIANPDHPYFPVTQDELKLLLNAPRNNVSVNLDNLPPDLARGAVRLLEEGDASAVVRHNKFREKLKDQARNIHINLKKVLPPDIARAFSAQAYFSNNPELKSIYNLLSNLQEARRVWD